MRTRAPVAHPSRPARLRGHLRMTASFVSPAYLRLHPPPTQRSNPMNFDITDAAPEHKAGIVVRDDYDEFRATFEEFKSANDERLQKLERRRGDVVLEEKVERLNAALDVQGKRMDEFALKQARPVLEGRGRAAADAAGREHKTAFEAYVRSGDAASLRQ